MTRTNVTIQRLSQGIHRTCYEVLVSHQSGQNVTVTKYPVPDVTLAFLPILDLQAVDTLEMIKNTPNKMGEKVRKSLSHL